MFRAKAEGFDINPRVYAYYARQYKGRKDDQVYLSMARYDNAVVEWNGKPWVVKKVDVKAKEIIFFKENCEMDSLL